MVGDGLNGGTGRGAIKRGCKIGRWVPLLKTVAQMKQAKSGKGLGTEASIEMLLGRVEVGIVLTASRAPESHSTNKSPHRTRREHPFLHLSC